MSAKSLNHKFRNRIEDGFAGVESNFEPIDRYLDRLLRLLIHRHPGFKLKQIKIKMFEVCFYSNLHLIFKDDDRERDHTVSVKIQARLEKQSKKT